MSGPDDTAESGLTVAADQAGQTLAALVREMIPGLSWSKARDLCQSGRVQVDGERATDPARRLAAGERVELQTGGPALPRSPVPREGLVHVDADVVVVRKPPGFLTAPFEREDRDTLLALTRVAVRRLEVEKQPARKSEPNPRLRAVQRLDKETSGLVVFARNAQAERLLQEQLAEHTVTRRYLAIVHGRAEDADYDTVLVPDRGDGLRGSLGVFRPARGAAGPVPGKPAGQPAGKRAVTHVQVLEHLKGATLVACTLETGRTHQIRIHLSEAGHPLVGEPVYIRDWRGPWLPAPRLMLHAAVLGFIHPRSGRPVRFEDPPPDDFAAVLESLKP